VVLFFLFLPALSLCVCLLLGFRIGLTASGADVRVLATFAREQGLVLLDEALEVGDLRVHVSVSLVFAQVKVLVL
jgi:hypothetical protein